ncbi:MAG TPA: hypothetical protein VF828_02900 [Patescibacteria group bacterium]
MSVSRPEGRGFAIGYDWGNRPNEFERGSRNRDHKGHSHNEHRNHQNYTEQQGTLKFTEATKKKIKRRQFGISPITGETITQYHHLVAKGFLKDCNERANDVENGLGVGIVAHAVIHKARYDRWGYKDDLNGFEGQVGNMNEYERNMFEEIIRDEAVMNEWSARVSVADINWKEEFEKHRGGIPDLPKRRLVFID